MFSLFFDHSLFSFHSWRSLSCAFWSPIVLFFIIFFYFFVNTCFHYLCIPLYSCVLFIIVFHFHFMFSIRNSFMHVLSLSYSYLHLSIFYLYFLLCPLIQIYSCLPSIFFIRVFFQPDHFHSCLIIFTISCSCPLFVFGDINLLNDMQLGASEFHCPSHYIRISWIFSLSPPPFPIDFPLSHFLWFVFTFSFPTIFSHLLPFMSWVSPSPSEPRRYLPDPSCYQKIQCHSIFSLIDFFRTLRFSFFFVEHDLFKKKDSLRSM